MATREISDAGIALITSFEGLRLTAYQDQGGVWTIGWGSTDGVYEGMRITEEQAGLRLHEDLEVVSHAVDAMAPETATQGQFDALCSFAFNLGVSALRKSTLLAKFRAGDVQGAADEFLKWDHVDGKEVEGLLARRQAERAMFLGASNA